MDWHFIVGGNSTDCGSASLFYACIAFILPYIFNLLKPSGFFTFHQV